MRHLFKGLKRKVIAASILLSLGLGGIAGYFTSKAYVFERDTGGHYLGEVEPEIQGVYAHKFIKPSDNKYSTQKNYSMSILGDIETVWDSYTGKGTTVAVIDDGFDHDHPEYTRADGTSALSNDSAYFYSSGSSYGVKYYKNDKTCLDEDWDTDYDEWATHGTNTSTTAAAPMNNGGGVGIAPEATILALKIDMSFVAIKGAINYAISKGVDVINMSLGAFAENFKDGFGDSQSGSSSTATYLDPVCKNAYNAGIIVVAAAGNEATYHKSYPACNYKVIGVGALEENDADTLAAFTNYVSSSQTGEINVDILAPGYVYTAGITGNSSSSHTATWHATQGTSFSSPIVAGAACLWKQKNPNGTPDQFLDELQATAAGIGSYRNKYVPVHLYGSKYTDQGPSNITNGRLDVGALMLSSNEVSGVDISSTSLSVYTSGSRQTGELSANVKPANADDTTLTWSISDSSVATLSKTYTASGEKVQIAGKKAGSAVITAVSNENPAYKATCQVNVATWVPVTGISLLDINGNSSSEIAKRGTIQLVPTLTPSNASNNDFIVESNNTSIATIDSDYVVKGVSAGTTTIEALIEDDNENYLTSTYTVTVTANQGTGTFVIDLYDASNLNESSSQTGANLAYFTDRVSLDGTINNSIVTNYSGDVAYLRKGGLAFGTSKKDGSCTITLNSDYPVSSVNIIGTIWDTTCGLRLNGTDPSGSLNPAGTVLSNCKNVLTFDELGDATSLNFVANNRLVIYQIECECEVPAGVAVTGISLSQTSANLDIYNNQSITLTATVTPNNATNKSVNWSTSDANVATVNNGVVVAQGVGSATITATTRDGGKTATCTINVTDSTPAVDPDDPTPTPVSGSGDFEKVTDTNDLEDGDYLIVYEDNSVAFDGGLTSLDSAKNTIDVEIVNDTIEATDEALAAVFTLDVDDGSLLSTSGKYIGKTASGNGMNVGDEPMSHTITIDSSDNAVITSSGGPKLKFNNGADQKRFRYYGSGQEAIQLYKLDAGPTLKSVSLDKTALSLDVYNNSTGSLTATVTQDEGVNASVSWSSSNTDVAIVSGGNTLTPTITALSAGSATITAIATANNVTKTATCTVTVTDSTPIPVTGLSLDKEEVTLNNVDNKTTTLTASYLPANANQLDTTWTTSDESVITISSTTGSSISLTAHESGVAVVTASCNGYIASCSVTVNDVLVSSVTLDKTTAKLFKNDTVTLTATISPSQVTDGTLEWETSDSSIATISATTGSSITVTGKGSGRQTATITVRSTDGSNKSATCVITMVELESIEFNDLPTSTPYKSTFSLGSTKVIAHYSDETSKDVTSSATINTSLVNTDTIGPKNVTASYTEKGVTKEVTGQVMVTNNGAASDVGVNSYSLVNTTATYSFTSKDDTSGTISNKGLSYSASGSSGFESDRGLQWSKSSGTITITGLTSSDKLKSVSVVASANSSAGTASVKIGSTTFGSFSISNGDSKVTKTVTSAQGMNAGTITINLPTGNKSVWIKTFTLNYDKVTQVTYKATPTEQAESWATYFLQTVKVYCNNSGIGSDVTSIASKWSTLAAEYGYMTKDAKDAFVNGSSGDISEARQLYSLIYSKYHSQLGDNNFVTDGDDTPIAMNNYGIRGIVNTADISLIIIASSIISLAAFSAYLFFRKRRIQK